MCRGECFYFDYGAVAFWNLSERQEREVIRMLLGPCLVDTLTQSEIEIDEFQVRSCLACVFIFKGRWGKRMALTGSYILWLLWRKQA